jgi:NADP-dependent 3-hydroxy acid dehydrogenase YdfG
VLTGSTAGRWVYEGGAGYTAAKHGLVALRETLRLELVERGIRVSEIAPGMVRTEEFSLNRFGGDQARADAVYEGVEPLTAQDVADAITWVATRPAHVNIDLVQLTPLAQAAVHKVVREP